MELGTIPYSRLKRLSRALMRSGFSVVLNKSRAASNDTKWIVSNLNDKRKRCSFALSQSELEELKKLNLLQNKNCCDVFIWNEAAFDHLALSSVQENDRPLRILTAQPNALPKSGFARLAAKAEQGIGPLNQRHVQAALGFVQDLEMACFVKSQVMNWSVNGNIRSIGQNKAQHAHSNSVLNAKRRVEKIESHMAQFDMQLVKAACVSEKNMVQLSQQFGLSQNRVIESLVTALDVLADVYDFKLKGGRS